MKDDDAVVAVAFDDNVDEVAVELRLVVSDDSDVFRAVKIVGKRDVTIAEREDDSSFLKLPTMVQDIFLLFKCMNQKIMLKIYVMSWR